VQIRESGRAPRGAWPDFCEVPARVPRSDAGSWRWLSRFGTGFRQWRNSSASRGRL